MLQRWRNGLALGLLAFLGVVQAQEATILFTDRATKKTGESITGEIEEENFKGVKIKPSRGKESKVIAGSDIERIMYKTKDVDPISYRTPFNKEDRARTASPKLRGTYLAEALEGYTKLEKEVKSPPAARRYFQYKIADVAVLRAKFDPTKTDLALKALGDFKGAHKEGWELPIVLETLARIQEEGNKFDDARKTYEELAELPGAPEELKQQSGVLVGKLFLRGREFKEAETRLSKVVESMSGANPQKPLAQAYLIESQIGQDKMTTAQKDLTALIRGTSDPRLRSVAYALLGDYYYKKGQQAEAFWNYLRVDAQYNEDADAHARALFHLSTLFDKVKKNPRRGKECLNRLLDKRFEGSPYQKQAQAIAAKE